MISHRAHAVVDRVKSPIRPLFIEERGVPSLVGTGVLVEIGSETFLLSAAHVLDLRDSPLYVLGAGKLLPLTGEYLASSKPAAGRQADVIDAGAVRLTDDLVHAIHALSPLTIRDLALDDRAWEVPSSRSYLVLGYPATKAKPRRSLRTVKAKLFACTAVPRNLSTYEQFAVADFSHVVLAFDRERMTTIDGHTIAPDVHGVSGGAIWTFGANFDLAGREAKLAAIFTEWHKAPTNAVMGTRIAMFTEMIRHGCSHLSSFIPPPQGVRIALNNSGEHPQE